MRLIDYHVHSKYSPDGRDEIHDLVAAAVLRNIEEICITDHYECMGNWTKDYDPKGFFEDIEKARYIYEGTIAIRAGIELGNPWETPKVCDKLLGKYNYDYVLGSVHTLTKDLSHYNYANEDMNEIMKEYVEGLNKLIDYGNFDCLAHLDLPRRYANMCGVDIDIFADYKSEFEEIFTRLRDSGKGIEVNTSGLRTKMQKTMPELDIIRIWHDIGGGIITVGSDAHTKDGVGVFVEDGIDAVIESGFMYISTYENRHSKLNPLEYHEYA